mgnify:CR=1 FL=1
MDERSPDDLQAEIKALRSALDEALEHLATVRMEVVPGNVAGAMSNANGVLRNARDCAHNAYWNF